MGDKVEAKTSVDLLSHGQIVLPRNTKILGHVTEVKTRSKDSPDSAVGITFDHLLFKDGHELPIQVAVQAIGRPLQNIAPGYESMGENPAGMAPAGPPNVPGTVGGSNPPGGMGGGTGNPSSPYPQGTRGEPDNSGPRNPSSGTTIAPLGPTSQGAVGMKGISLTTSAQTATISSSTQNVHLDGGSQLMLKTE